MDRPRKRTLRHLLLIIAALAWAVCLGFGQNGQNGNGQNGNGNGNGNGKGKVCKPDKEKCTTNDPKWQAAINHANRRADDYRKHPDKAKGHN